MTRKKLGQNLILLKSTTRGLLNLKSCSHLVVCFSEVGPTTWPPPPLPCVAPRGRSASSPRGKEVINSRLACSVPCAKGWMTKARRIRCFKCWPEFIFFGQTGQAHSSTSPTTSSIFQGRIFCFASSKVCLKTRLV